MSSGEELIAEELVASAKSKLTNEELAHLTEQIREDLRDDVEIDVLNYANESWIRDDIEENIREWMEDEILSCLCNGLKTFLEGRGEVKEAEREKFVTDLNVWVRENYPDVKRWWGEEHDDDEADEDDE
jgi:hypothetical protein